MVDTSEQYAKQLDREDPLRAFRDRFCVKGDRIYMVGNSLGVQPRAARASVERVLDEWRELGVNGWGEAEKPWFWLAERLGESGARLVGARGEDVVATGTTTVNIHALVASFYQPEGRRNRILADELNFPSDLYALQGQLALRGLGPDELVLVRSSDGRTLDEAAIIELMTDEVALVFLPAVLYGSGQLLDVERLTRAAHDRGIAIGWDCCHSAGVVPHQLARWDVDFALWCSYKYLNGGPGSSAFLFVNERHRELRPLLAGWFGFVKERQFEMQPEFQPQPGARGWQISSPGILAAAPLEASLAISVEAGIDAVREKSTRATTYLIGLVDALLADSPYGVGVATPREPERRGGHVALTREQGARSMAEALRARGVIVDFRPPDMIRIAPAPLYNSYLEIWRVVRHIKEIIDAGEHREFERPQSVIP